MEPKKITLTDLYAASFLKLNGITPDFVVVRGKVLFSYPVNDTLYKLLNEYNSGGACPVADFVEVMKDLRNRMISAKGGAR